MWGQCTGGTCEWGHPSHGPWACGDPTLALQFPGHQPETACRKDRFLNRLRGAFPLLS